ncbi:MAG: Protein translocase subunit SecA [Candidatus Uhrbacteria bacterium GW2011_GWF2_41_16]|uniref:Protein translocase subunit SecA n=2 Tax=Candidatus Uhriibacteriota TaxID=1752732 RepID=A0A0G0V6R1_9BACT|nr:MAG: Protein translocase subunit SecA [Candidatus Uhrbacteria bacterium GW2011_GWC2_41_11]KKR96698.1 MAG: Protein translocase subunit SecA [Candidatus Uhrbacteria bacterium GW2011_GWF2_41_16]HBP00496.1 preprotein translocase subunit SecA [Candidatus Uhrbacteria bacterium]
MPDFLKMIFGDPNKKIVADLQKRVEKINAFESSFQTLSDEMLRAKTTEFKERLTKGETLDDLLPEAFAAVREASKRQLKQRHFDVQLMGGMVLHRGAIAEMRTGEGKTLTATAPLYLNALAGKGCHLVTVNDYLARRDAVWMGQIFYALGLSVSSIQHDAAFLYDPAYKHVPESETEGKHDEERDTTGSFRVHMDYMRPVSRKEAYAADITYGTNNEFGFDYLRDNMVSRLEQKVQRKLYFAIVDEVDSILIDEARTPLIISAPAEESNQLYYRFVSIVQTLVLQEDYNVDEKMRATTLTESGIAKIEKALGIENLYVQGGITMVHHAEQALRAHALYKCDRDYVVKEGEVIIVDEFTGRLMHGRRYSEGLHQAIEAKEGVPIQRESETLATITFQNYFRMYEKLAGMTGTAATEAEEFGKIYHLEVTSIPTSRPNCRVDLADRVYKNESGKFLSVAREVKRLHEIGQPVLIGTISIEKNEQLSELLKREGVPHNILNAKNHEKEAEFIAQAGRRGAVTLATNMAGRGVDIILGGNPPDAVEAEKVRKLGGLFVIGTERHESRRIDNQLRGRCGRQGDPGKTQFYVSMEDDLMRIFGSDRVRRMMDALGIPDDESIENRMVTSSIEKAQQRVEGHHFDTRKHLLEYDDVLNKHRELLYTRREEVLAAYEEPHLDALQEKILEITEDELEQIVLFHTNTGTEFGSEKRENGDWDTKEIMEVIQTILPLSEEAKRQLEEAALKTGVDKLHVAEQRTRIIETSMNVARKIYGEIVEKMGNRARLKDLERNVILRAMDRLWIDHLAAMTQLRTGIGLRGYGQLDPLVEYKKEAFGMFNRLLAAINEEIANNFFKVATHAAQAQQAITLGKSLLERAGVVLTGAVKTAGSTPVPSTPKIGGDEKVGRNDDCPCGSGKKYKKCHGA